MHGLLFRPDYQSSASCVFLTNNMIIVQTDRMEKNERREIETVRMIEKGRKKDRKNLRVCVCECEKERERERIEIAIVCTCLSHFFI